jgi:hypothetical protein
LLLCLHLYTQRATGTLHLHATPGAIVFAEGNPLALRDARATHAILQTFTKLGRLPSNSLAGLLASTTKSDRPRELCRALLDRRLLSEAECSAILERRLDNALLAVLRHRGTWSFVQESLHETELFPSAAARELRQRMIDLLPRAATIPELFALLGGPRAVLRSHTGIEHIATAIDARFLSLLDGRYPLEDALEVAAVPVDRALAALVTFTLFGLAEKIDPPSRSALDRSLPPLDPNPPEPELAIPTLIPLEEDRPTIAPPPLPARHVTLRPFARAWLSSEDRTTREHELRAYAEVIRTSDYFTILGVEPGAPAEAIAAAHRRITKSLRPEDFQKNPELYGLAREVLRSVDEAWDVLSVPELRTAYQQHLKPHTRH